MELSSQFINALKQSFEAEVKLDAIWLYGSYAKGEATEQSDIDIAVLFSEYEDDKLERVLRPESLREHWYQKLDVPFDKLSIVDIEIVPVALAWEVISTGKLLFFKNEIHAMRIENKIMSQYELDLIYHREHYA